MIDIAEAIAVNGNRRSIDRGCGYGRSPHARVSVSETIVRNIHHVAERWLIKYHAGAEAGTRGARGPMHVLEGVAGDVERPGSVRDQYADIDIAENVVADRAVDVAEIDDQRNVV